MVVAMWWVEQITAISLEMVLPAVLGHWLDGRFGTEPWLVVVGALLGFAAAMTHLLSMARRGTGRTGRLGGSGRFDRRSGGDRPGSHGGRDSNGGGDSIPGSGGNSGRR